jgi:signal transduction histidine kinase
VFICGQTAEEFPVPGKAVGRAAADLPWLGPNTDSLIGLAENPAAVGRLSAADPGLLVFLLRFGPAADAASFSLSPERLLAPVLPETAAAFLTATADGWPAPSPAVTRAKELAHAAATFARRLAARTGRTAPEAAAAAARLAPLAWFAVGAVDASDVFSDPGFAADPSGTQERHWGLDHDAIARRLAARWRLPRWVATIPGGLNLSFRAARTITPDPTLFAAVQLAVREAEGRVADLGLTRGADRDGLLAHLGLDQSTTDELFGAPVEPAGPPARSGLDPNPHRVPLLVNLLRAAGEARRRNGAALVVRLEERVDELYRGLADLAGLTADRLRDAKLVGLAELAAGAGHEINNPLAVISGSAQRLLRSEPDPDRADALRTIVRQTQRITGILRELMQFARPGRPERRRFPVGELVAAVRDELAPLAAEREVRLELAAPAAVWLDADPKQLRTALTAVVRNGVEAAGSGGWVRLTCDTSESGVRLVVEDSGPGLTPDAAEHAFDPFFCGRSAGRGRGLGLPTAWRLARENGGDVRYEPTPSGVTRFALSLPRAAEADRPERLSA